MPEQGLQKATLDLQVAQTGLDSARANVAMRQRELETAKANLIEGTAGADDANCCIEVRAPVSGQVLQVMTPNEQVVQAGTPLATLGDPADLEVAVDLLSRDAVVVNIGDPASIEDWGGPPLKAVVERIDPAAVTKVSALGIEEQRVTTVLRLLDPPAVRVRLGHDFRVVARITVWHANNLLAVPNGALFRQDGDWAVYKVEGGSARIAKVELGRRNSDYAELLDGLAAGDQVILHPSDHVSDGVAVTPEAPAGAVSDARGGAAGQGGVADHGQAGQG
jgi:HlyD family secretion protein